MHNFEVALSAGTWGCPAPQTAELRPGDRILFVGGVPGGPRQTGERPVDPSGEAVDSDRAWMSRTASFCWTATATSTWFENDQQIWEPAPDKYRYRFTFDNAIDRGQMSLVPNVNLSREASLAIKLAGLQVQNGGLQCQRLMIGAAPLLDSTASAISDGSELDTSTFNGDLGIPTNTLARAEQSKLRQGLLRESTRCALCGKSLPEELLVAAHIKKRSQCSDEEKRDLVNVAMLACKLGCDIAFELGVVIVDSSGVVRVNQASPLKDSTDLFARLEGNRCLAYRNETSNYFGWHRLHHGAL